MAKKTRIEDICKQLREKLTNGDLPPESRIVEQDLAVEFGVSRTPVREAIRRLASEGYLVSVPNLGTFVKRFSLADVKEMFEIREVLEGLAFKNAANCPWESSIDLVNRLKSSPVSSSVSLNLSRTLSARIFPSLSDNSTLIPCKRCVLAARFCDQKAR